MARKLDLDKIMEERRQLEFCKGQYHLLDRQAKYKENQPLDYLFDKMVHPDQDIYLPHGNERKSMSLDSCLRKLSNSSEGRN